MSQIDPGNTVNSSGTDPDKGMKTKPFLVAVLVALVVLLLIIVAFVHKSSTSITPQRDAKPGSSQPQ